MELKLAPQDERLLLLALHLSLINGLSTFQIEADDGGLQVTLVRESSGQTTQRDQKSKERKEERGV